MGTRTTLLTAKEIRGLGRRRAGTEALEQRVDARKNDRSAQGGVWKQIMWFAPLFELKLPTALQ